MFLYEKPTKSDLQAEASINREKVKKKYLMYKVKKEIMRIGIQVKYVSWRIFNLKKKAIVEWE